MVADIVTQRLVAHPSHYPGPCRRPAAAETNPYDVAGSVHWWPTSVTRLFAEPPRLAAESQMCVFLGRSGHLRAAHRRSLRMPTRGDEVCFHQLQELRCDLRGYRRSVGNVLGQHVPHHQEHLAGDGDDRLRPARRNASRSKSSFQYGWVPTATRAASIIVERMSRRPCLVIRPP